MHGIERRIIYILMLVALAIPLVTEFSLPPSRKKKAEEMFELVEKTAIGPNDVAFVWMDFGPNTKAENEAQAEVMVEHLMRRRIPFVAASLYQLSEAFLSRLPARVAARLEKEMPGERWAYGTDWISVGYKPGSSLMIQNLAKANNLTQFLDKDVNGFPISGYPRFANMRGLENVKLLLQVTGLVGVFDIYVQFFGKEGYRPVFLHGCTSITIPEAYIFLDSGQLNGLLEGLAGAAAYSAMLSKKYPERAKDKAILTNSALGVGHLVIIVLIVAGNVFEFMKRRRVGAYAR